MALYLSYDIKGVQRYIFSASRLKYVIGASLVVNDFDVDSNNLNLPGVASVYCGGGKGCFECSSEEAADKLRKNLLKRARTFGLDLRLGIAPTYEEASLDADDFYPYIPSDSLGNIDLNGAPCVETGLWPTKNESGICSVVEKCAEYGKEDPDWHNEGKLNREILNRFESLAPKDMRRFAEEFNLRFEFFSVVRAQSCDEEDVITALVADCALGSSGRWAIISMDGNDMGAQFRSKKNLDEKEKIEWTRKFSRELRKVTEEAFIEGLVAATEEWWSKAKNNERLLNLYREAGAFILPFRPLILGDDDILCISATSCAFTLAKTISKRFTERSQEVEKPTELWQGTNGKLTIDAGVLFCAIRLPLSQAIPYAESLLDGAKKKFRDKQPKGEPSPAAIDWETITDSTLDSPKARRQRDSVFFDEDLNERVELVARPLRFSDAPEGEFDFEEAEELVKSLRDVPVSVLETFATNLRKPWAERSAAALSYARRQEKLVKALDEGVFSNKLGSCWKRYYRGGDPLRVCVFLDALGILREQNRTDKEDVQ